MSDNVKCPKCGYDNPRHNALHDFAPIEEQFLFTCPKCQHQYNFTGEDEQEQQKEN